MEDNDDHQLSEVGVPFMTEAEIAADHALIAEAMADLEAGRCVPQDEVAAWLKTWGTGKRVPPPKSWFR